jgi:hypothetical protein
MTAAKRCIFLAGAPQLEDLRWDERHLRTGFTLPVKRFLKDDNEAVGDALTQATPPLTDTKWRHLALNGSGLSKPMNDQDGKRAQFLSFEDDHPAKQHNDFLERSMAFLDNINPVHILPSASTSINNDDMTPETTFLSTTSFTSTNVSSLSPGRSESFFVPHVENGEIAAPITDLKRIPNADYITNIRPQTMTVNLIVGIISIGPPRTVRVRRRNVEMDIVELTVGDETRAGFGISFWLASLDSQRKAVDDLRRFLSRLRAGDVVLLKNVALTCWRGCVFGQSLSRKFARNSTSVSVISDGESDAKMDRVRRWTGDFVGLSTNTEMTKPISRDFNALPPDTQD